jgi:hypothetical protein
VLEADLPEAVLLLVVVLVVQGAVEALPLQEHRLVVGLPSPGQQGEVFLAYEQRQQVVAAVVAVAVGAMI